MEQRVVASMAGHATQVRRADGTGTLVVSETLSIHGTFEGLVLARFTPTSFHAAGAGVLLTGHGTTALSGPNASRREITCRSSRHCLWHCLNP